MGMVFPLDALHCLAIGPSRRETAEYGIGVKNKLIYDERLPLPQFLVAIFRNTL
jgi:hypothetical protein